jgi:hypothetical protein
MFYFSSPETKSVFCLIKQCQLSCTVKDHKQESKNAQHTRYSIPSLVRGFWDE